MMRLNRLLTAFALPIATLAGPAAAQAPPARASEPIAAVMRAFADHPVVALGEGDHNNEPGHAFRLALLRDPRFARSVDDIVVEFGNARHQAIIDRFVAGEDVAPEELQRVWQDTTQPHAVWDVPIYEAFFRAVREVNATLPAENQLRVLLGDPPVDWTGVTTFRALFAQMRQVGDRDGYPAKLIQREVLDKGRRALIVYGDQHLSRTPAALRPGCQEGSTIPCYPGSIVDQLEASSGVRVFTITTVTGVDLRTLEADAASWPTPSLAAVAGTTLGAMPYRSLLPPGPLMIGPDGQPQPEPPSMRRPVEQAFDAVLYLGPPSAITYSQRSPELCADPGYIAMRTARMAMAGQAATCP